MKVEIKFVEEIEHFYKLYSVWVFTTLLCLPDLYNQAISSGFIAQDKVPPFFSHLVSTISLIGLVVRFINQKKPTSGMTTVAEELNTPSEPVQGSTPGIAIIAPVPNNVQEAMDENTRLEALAKQSAEAKKGIDQSHLS